MTRDTLTYRFPRTLVQAFGTDAQSAVAIERHKRPLADRVADWMLAVLIAVGIVAITLHSLGAL